MNRITFVLSEIGRFMALGALATFMLFAPLLAWIWLSIALRILIRH